MKRILLVEDDKDVRILVEEELREAGYEVDATKSVAGAVSRLDTRSYDLLLTDGRLPDGTGLTLAAVAKKEGIKVILFTGFINDFALDVLDEITVLLKPADMDRVVETVHQTIGAGSPAVVRGRFIPGSAEEQRSSGHL